MGFFCNLFCYFDYILWVIFCLYLDNFGYRMNKEEFCRGWILGVIIMKEKKMEYFIVVSKNGITYLGLWWDFDDVGLVGVEVFLWVSILSRNYLWYHHFKGSNYDKARSKCTMCVLLKFYIAEA